MSPVAHFAPLVPHWEEMADALKSGLSQAYSGDVTSKVALTKAAAKKALDSLLVDIEGSLQKGNRVSLVGFGSWSVTRRAARDGRNPQTGKTIKIKAKNVVKFKAGSDLSSAVN